MDSVISRIFLVHSEIFLAVVLEIYLAVDPGEDGKEDQTGEAIYKFACVYPLRKLPLV